MAFNLNTSRKPELALASNHIDEVISMYGIKCKYLYTEKVNIDYTVFKDFSHLKIGEDFEDLYLLPEETENWDGDVVYNNFGMFNQWTQQLFISKKSMYKLFPNFLETGRHELVNSLIVTPSGTLLEITHVESFTPGITNVWGYADQPSSYKLSVKIYDHNLADEGITSVKTTIELEEKVQKEGAGGEEETIFTHDEAIDTSDIDAFFESLEVQKEDIEKESTTGTKETSIGSGRTGSNNTNSPFGDLS